jgi:hypothetical protein
MTTALKSSSAEDLYALALLGRAGLLQLALQRGIMPGYICEVEESFP